MALLAITLFAQAETSTIVRLVYGDKRNAESFAELINRAGMVCELSAEATLGQNSNPAADLVVFLSCCKKGGNPAIPAILKNLGSSRVLACGESGAYCLGEIHLLIGLPNGWHGTHQPKSVVFPKELVNSGFGQVLIQPNKLIRPDQDEATLVIHSGKGPLMHVGIYDGGQFPQGTIGIGREEKSRHHWLICKQGNYTLWGCDSRADNLTEDGKGLFVNLCWHLAHSESEPLIFPEKQYIKDGTYTGVLKGNYQEKFHYSPKTRGKLVLRLDWDEPVSMIFTTRGPFNRRDGRSPLEIIQQINEDNNGIDLPISVESFELAEGKECPYRLTVQSSGGADDAASTLQPCHVDEPPELKGADYTFDVDIVSGTQAGKTFRGAFTLPPLNPAITGNIQVVDFRFCYAGKLYDMSNFDPLYGSMPRATVVAGKFVRLECCGGSVRSRFGFTNGFERTQFGRPSEDFVRNGEDYFGYLNPETIVDGGGRITYRQVGDK